MKIVDMSHVMNVHTPGWVGYAGNKMYYAQNLQTQMIVAQRIDTALHVGTHFDGAMHATDDPKGDMASLPLDYLVNRGVVVDISAKMSDWAIPRRCHSQSQRSRPWNSLECPKREFPSPTPRPICVALKKIGKRTRPSPRLRKKLNPNGPSAFQRN